jgi:hypothetical protein
VKTPHGLGVACEDGRWSDLDPAVETVVACETGSACENR